MTWTIAAAVLGTLLVAYAVFVATALGLVHRLRLACGPISLDRIVDVAARRYGDEPIFTTDADVTWAVPTLAARHPDARTWSAVRLRDTADHVAGALLGELGLQHGDRVALLKSNHLDIHVLHTAVVRAGGVACPMNGHFVADKVDPYLRNVGASLLFTDVPTLLRVLREDGSLGTVRAGVLADTRLSASDDELAELEERLRRVQPEVALHWIEDLLARATPATPRRRGSKEVLYLVHSSGTTGFPKAVILRNGRQAHAVRGWLCYVHASRKRDRGYFALPHNHQAVILTFNAALLGGFRAHWTSGYGRGDVDPQRIVRELAEGGYTGFFAFPVVYTQLKELPLRQAGLSGMRYWGSTADAAHEAVIRPFTEVGSVVRRLGIPVDGSVYLDAQGSSEVGTPSVLRRYTRFTRRYGRRIGKPGSTPFGPEVRIARDGVPVPRGEVGRLEVRGRTVTEGYWDDPALTGAAVRDGWFFTGDVARFSRDGHVVQLDREVDVIHTPHGDVYSLLVEERVHQHPAVFDACVYGARLPDGRQSPAAAVAVRAGVATSVEVLTAELNSVLGPAEQLAHVEVLPWEAFPLGVTGKTLKRVFRTRVAALSVSPPDAPAG